MPVNRNDGVANWGLGWRSDSDVTPWAWLALSRLTFSRVALVGGFSRRLGVRDRPSIGGSSYAPAAPHAGGGQFPALHFSPSTPVLRRRIGVRGRLREHVDGGSVQSFEAILGIGMMELRVPGQVGQGIADSENRTHLYVPVFGDGK